MKVERVDLINSVASCLRDTDYVRAVWLEGADSLGRVDEYSDIDLWIDTLDEKVDDTVELLSDCLNKICSIDYFHETNHNHPKIRQFFLHLSNTSEFLIIDVCIQSHSRVFWFTEEMEGEKARVLFDKDDVIQFKPKDRKKMDKELEERKKYLLGEYPARRIDVLKEIERNDYLGALNFYLEVASIITELYRIKYSPTKYNFGLKHIKNDLPPKQNSYIQKIYSHNNTQDLRNNVNLIDIEIRKLV